MTIPAFRSRGVGVPSAGCATLGVMLAALACIQPARAADSTLGAGAAAATTHVLTRQDIEAFLDDLIPKQQAKIQVPGTVIAIVKDGEVLFSKGYGLSDVAARTPISPATTLMRMGSISKVFAWVAVMQLVERGQIDLDRDLNDYLDFRLTPPGAKPITMRHLMTHTAGFALNVKDVAFLNRESLSPLATWVKTHVPEQVFEPGSTMSYSIYGPALAGYIVERISGRPFERYADENLLGPLGMTQSTFHEPAPPALAPSVSVGYMNGGGRGLKFEYMPIPTGAMSCTADDMAKFMLAMLPGSPGARPRPFQAATLDEMQTVQVAPIAGAGAGTLGWWEQHLHGQRILGHAGTTSRFHAMIKLLVDAHAGLFIASNSPGGDRLSTVVFDRFLERYFPVATVDPELSPTFRSDAAAVAGTYVSTRSMKSDIIRVLALFSQFDVTPTPDGGITVGNWPKTYHSVGNLRFHVKGYPARYDYLFRRDERGRMLLMPASTDVAFSLFLRQPAADHRELAYAAVGLGLLTGLGVLLTWPVSAWRRRKQAPTRTAPALVALRVASAVDVVLLAAWSPLIRLGQGESDARYWLVSSESNGLFRCYSVLGLLSVAVTAVAVVLVLRSLATGGGSRWSRWAFTGAAAGLAAFSWFVVHWDLASTRIQF